MFSVAQVDYCFDASYTLYAGNMPTLLLVAPRLKSWRFLICHTCKQVQVVAHRKTGATRAVDLCRHHHYPPAGSRMRTSLHDLRPLRPLFLNVNDRCFCPKYLCRPSFLPLVALSALLRQRLFRLLLVPSRSSRFRLSNNKNASCRQPRQDCPLSPLSLVLDLLARFLGRRLDRHRYL